MLIRAEYKWSNRISEASRADQADQRGTGRADQRVVKSSGEKRFRVERINNIVGWTRGGIGFSV